MNIYTGTYNDYRTIYIWKHVRDKFCNKTFYLLVAKIYTFPECHRVVVTKKNTNDAVNELKIYNKKTNELQYTLVKNHINGTEFSFECNHQSHILTYFFFVKKLNTENVERFLFAELI